MAYRARIRLFIAAILAIVGLVGALLIPSAASANATSQDGHVKFGHPATAFPGGYSETEFYVGSHCRNWDKGIQGVDAYIIKIDPSLSYFNAMVTDPPLVVGMTITLYAIDKSSYGCSRIATHERISTSEVATAPINSAGANWAVVSFADGYEIDFSSKNCDAELDCDF
jgi:hypothetical protein